VDETGRHLSAGGLPKESELGWVGGAMLAPAVQWNFFTSGEFRLPELGTYMSFTAPRGITVHNMKFKSQK
jgi:hypothetical protein